MNFLDEIIAYKKEIVARKRKSLAGLKKNASSTRLTRYGLFKKAISKPGRLNLIAEIKKASPSRGLIRETFDCMALAETYVKSGADALSILTEDKFFLGKPAYIRKVTADFHIPVLTKDFIIDEVQVYETFNDGSSAILLIAAILDDAQLKGLIETAVRLDMDSLVEVHDRRELDRAVGAGAQIIGVNNRDLKTFKVDLGVSERLLPLIPGTIIKVVESGLKTREDILKCRDMGADAVLIGETFLRATDVGAKVRELMEGK